MEECIVTKKGTELTENEIDSLSRSVQKEFGVAFDREDMEKKLFFFLKKEDDILSMAGLFGVEGIFEEQKFPFFGVIEVIANQKGMGYGKRVVGALREYLIENDSIGLGYCMPKNIGFYEKCGFKSSLTTGQRFVCHRDGKEIRNQDGQVNFYQDISAGFMTNVLAKEGEITIPTDKLW